MIDWLLDSATKRQSGSAALGVLVAMVLWLKVPEAPSWFYFGGAFVVTWVCAGGVVEFYAHVVREVERAAEN